MKKVLLEISKFFWDKTKAPLKSMIESEAFILVFSKLPFLPKWCVKVAVKWTLNRTAYPIIDEVYAEIGYKIEVRNGEVLLKKIQNSTPSEWDDLSSRV